MVFFIFTSMKFKVEKNLILQNPETRSFLADAYIPEKEEPCPLVIFCHGYKGYKDWGAWSLVAEKFAKNGFYCVVFNFSHNGTTLDSPKEFKDLEAFAENNYDKELSDLDWVIQNFSKDKRVDSKNISLIGHSRGAGICIIKAKEHQGIKNLITWAGVDTMDRFPEEKREEWIKNGVYYTYNSRTKQQMPHHIQFLEDYERQIDRYHLLDALQKFKGNTLLVHGKEDEAVPFSAAENLQASLPQATLFILEKANHTFGSKEPWLDFKLPEPLKQVVNKSIQFLKSHS